MDKGPGVVIVSALEATHMSNDSLPAYTPKNASFHFRAVCAFAAALQPVGFDADDARLAERTAHMCARALDSGVLPKNFVMFRTANILPAITRSEILNAATTNTPLVYATGGVSAHAGKPEAGHADAAGRVPAPFSYPAGQANYAPSMTEGEKATERAALAKLGTLPTRAEAMARNDEDIAKLAGISEPVRDAAFAAARARIAANARVTGATPTEALQIVVYEIERAMRLAGDLGRSVLARTEKANTAEQMFAEVPYPADLSLMLSMGEIAALFSEEETSDPAPATAAK